LQNKVAIAQASILNSDNPKKQVHTYSAIWDTGATGTVISKRVIEQCGLVPTGMTQVATAGGIFPVNTYIVDIMLPNNVIFPNLNVTTGDLNGTDVLIGMDIMSQGDFSVSNFEGKTSGIKNLLLDMFVENSWYFPPQNLCKKYATIIENINNKIDSNKINNLELISLRDSLLPMLMNGQVTVE
jgi:predicted aspartyl protease